MLLSSILVLLSLAGSSHAACPASFTAPYDISLTPNTLTTTSPTFKSGLYYIQPCGNVDVSHCPYSTGQQQCFAVTTWELVSDGLGSPDKTVWSAYNGDWANGAVSINDDIAYDYDQCIADPGTNEFKTTYFCDRGDDSLILVSEPDSGNNGPCRFEFRVDSSIVCGHTPSGDGGGSKKGLSGGWIFTIILIVVFSVYFIGGIAWNRMRKGLSGTEMIPNRDFWTGLPGLAKDGCSYFVQKCKGLCNCGGSTSGDTSFASM